MSNRVNYLQDVTGYEIVQAQDVINNRVGTQVRATQIFPKKDSLYDAFIYFEDNRVQKTNGFNLTK